MEHGHVKIIAGETLTRVRLSSVELAAQQYSSATLMSVARSVDNCGARMHRGARMYHGARARQDYRRRNLDKGAFV
eukprot:CAMPEP_0171907454 /NCGR_PEP_ID=MMETSP0993-20121228/6980_1 /TAXON_ID=483369 /ORGANISM="non described non described, Strain CCMP2098" /LENGTH=75 /DNA_ID=CAMNT_0012539691 /DNA_START=1 /DNA_END=224 /DNA_ORIENTATION=+